MIPAWMIEELRRQEKERQEAEERSRVQIEIPVPPQDYEPTLKKIEDAARKVITIDVL